MTLRHQDFTIFRIDDDTLPLDGYGSVDGDGNITEATFSTYPGHVRPYLKRVTDAGESVSDFQTGQASIGSTSVDIIDFPRDVGDQDSGLLTYLLATATTKDTALLGVRMVLREQDDAGDYQIIFDGVCSGIAMPKLTTFRISVKDARERERDLPLFDGPSFTCIFPRVGPAEGLGFQTEYDVTDGFVQVGDPVMQRIKGASGVFHLTGVDHVGIVDVGVDILTDEYYKLLAEFGAPTVVDLGGVLGTHTLLFGNVVVEWSATGDPGDYTRVGPMSVFSGLLGGPEIAILINRKRIAGQDGHWVVGIVLSSDDDTGLPDDGQAVFVRVLSNLPPRADVPLYIEERFGTLLKKAYDGDYTRDQMVPVSYDPTRMDEIIAATPFALARIEEPETDGRAWLQANVYQPTRMAPTIRNGKVYPMSFDLPDESVTLPQLDDSNTLGKPEWGHGADNVINQVVFNYDREIVPTDSPQFAKPTIQRAAIQRTTLADDSPRRHGTKPLTLSPVTLRALISSADTFDRSPLLDTAQLIASAFSDGILRRYANGAQVVRSRHARDATIDAIQPGQWVIGAWSALPDYITRKRGMNRLLQVISVSKPSKERVFVCVDAGPYDQPIAKPTVGELSERTDGAVDIPITDVPADGSAEVQFALGQAEPAATSGQWHSVATLDADGTARTPPRLWPGRTVWVRARGVAPGARSSAWTDAVSIELDQHAIMRHFTATFETDSFSEHYGKPYITWEALSTTAAIRIYYAVHDKDTEFTDAFVNYLDFDILDGFARLPVVLRQWERCTVQLEGYPTWDDPDATGTAGPVSLRRTIVRVEDHYIQPSVAEHPTRESSLGVLTLSVNDSQKQITKVQFRTRLGDDGEWSAFVEDDPPYSASVTVVPAEASAVGYEMYGYDHAGNEKRLQAGTYPFPFSGNAGLGMVFEQTSIDADNLYGDIKAIDPVPQGADSIAIIDLEPIATARLVDPPEPLQGGISSGTPTNDFSTTDAVSVQFSRPDAGSGDALEHFLAVADNRQRAEMTVNIPEKETTPATVDTVAVAIVDYVANTVQVTFSAAGDYNHFHVILNGGPLQPAGQTIFDVGVLLGYDLDAAGPNIRTITATVVLHTVAHAVLASADSAPTDFNANDDI